MPDRYNNVTYSTEDAGEYGEYNLCKAEMTGEEEPRSVHPGGVGSSEGRVPGVSGLVHVDDLLQLAESKELDS